METNVTIVIFVLNLIVSAVIALVVSFFRIGEYKNKVDTIETTLGKDDHCGLRKTVSDAKTELDKLLEFKISAQKFIDKNLYKEKSPLSLTEFGKQLVTDSGFEQIFSTVKDDLVHLLETKNPKTQYDAQEMARALMDELTDYEAFQPIKKYAFENGKDLKQILRAGAILLRDYFLEKHKEITQ